MRLCLLSRHFDLRNAGVGRISMEIANGLEARGHEVKRVSTKGRSLYSYFFYTGFQVPFLTPPGCEVYHALTPMEGAWTRGRGKSVVTISDLFLMTNPDKTGAGASEGLKNFIARKYFTFMSRLSAHCDIVVCVSEKTKEDVIQHLQVPEKKIRVIRSGISPSLEPKPRRDHTFRIGYLGQLDRRKRVNLLIEPFVKGKVEAELVIGGSGTEEAYLKSLAKGDPRVKFAGFVPDEELCDFYNSLDVLVFPSGIEGYGLPIVEAMACRKPAIVLSDSIIPWEIKSRCAIVGELHLCLWNLKYMKNLMTYLRIIDNYFFAKSHDWGKCIDKYEDVYREVLES